MASQRTIRWFSSWMLISIYAGLFASGDLLHLLPGHASCDHVALLPSSLNHSGCSHHEHGPISDQSHQAPADVDSFLYGGDCSICKLLGLRWIAVHFFAVSLQSEPLGSVALLPFRSPFRQASDVHWIRGPPTLLL